MQRRIRWYDYINFNIYYFGLTALSQTMTPLVVPLLVQSFVGVANQGRYYGSLRLWTLMAALLTQSLMGLLSDHSSLKWGKRRPFILAGTIGLIFVLIMVAFCSDMHGFVGYWVLFILVIFQMIASNTALAAQQGIIPDLVPLEKRGRFSAVKAVLEIPLPAVIVAFTISKLVSDGNLWASLLLLIGYVVIAALFTMFIPEKKPDRPAKGLDWHPFLQVFLMTAVFTIIIIGISNAVSGLISWFSDLPKTPFFILSVATGTAGIALAVVFGAWLSLRIALGKMISKHKSFTWWVISRLAYLVGCTNLVSFTIYFLQAKFGYQGQAAANPTATLTMFIGVFILISSLTGGWLTDKFGRKPLLILCGLIAAFGTLIVLISPPSLVLLYLGGSIIGLATGLFYTANWALGTIIIPQEQAGQFLGLSNIAGAGAGAIGAYIGGPLADQINRATPQASVEGYSLLFITFGLLFLVSILALKGVQDIRITPQHDKI